MLKNFRSPFLLILLLCSFKSSNTYFEGVITYRITIEQIDPFIPQEKIAAELGTECIFYFKNGNFKEVYNGTGIAQRTYVAAENKLYVKQNDRTKALVIDCSKSNEELELKNIQQLNKPQDVLGESNSNSLLLITKSEEENHFYKREYVFGQDLAINPDDFQKIKWNSYNVLFSKSGHLPVKMIFENYMYRATWTAVNIDKKEVDDVVFKQ